MHKWQIGIIGFGKIAKDQHLPVIQTSRNFELAAVSNEISLDKVSLGDKVPIYMSYDGLIQNASVNVVAICTPPQVRYTIASAALAADKHVLLEKPPAATLSELAHLRELALQRCKTLFAPWHSQYNAAVEKARNILRNRTVSTLRIDWKEHVECWHPGQDWIWEAGGFGVFDPGINALSIITRIVPSSVFVRKADLFFPSNKDTPIAANLLFSGGTDAARLYANLDWRPKGGETWTIVIETTDGVALELSKGGKILRCNGEEVVNEPAKPHTEYEAIYQRFSELLDKGESEVDSRPLQLVADAFLLGRRLVVEPFENSEVKKGR